VEQHWPVMIASPATYQLSGDCLHRAAAACVTNVYHWHRHARWISTKCVQTCWPELLSVGCRP